MKPYGRSSLLVAEIIFNYRLSRARQIVENTFGILVNRFGCLLSTLKQQPRVVIDVILSCICLHKLVHTHYPALQNAVLDAEDDQPNLFNGEWSYGAQTQNVLNVLDGNRATTAAKQQREYLKLYYNSPTEAVPWQLNCI